MFLRGEIIPNSATFDPFVSRTQARLALHTTAVRCLLERHAAMEWGTPTVDDYERLEKIGEGTYGYGRAALFFFCGLASRLVLCVDDGPWLLGADAA